MKRQWIWKQRPAKRRRRSPRRHAIECLEQRRVLAGSAVVINEIMYHPASKDPRDEFIELHNPTPQPQRLSGWKFSDGIQFTFPDVTIPSQGYLVVAADLARFRELHPAVSPLVGGWTGRLANRGETISLEDATGMVVDRIRYADQGEWSARQLEPDDHGFRGWSWKNLHDGRGASAELINAALRNDLGLNWRASEREGGTPGAVNSVASNDQAPLITRVRQFPPVPTSRQSVVVSIDLEDEWPAQVASWLHYRVDGSQAFRAVPLEKWGHPNDELPSDATRSAVIPPLPDRTIVEFYLTASNDRGQQRIYPPVVADDASRSANLLNYWLYRGTQDTRFRIISHDLDTLLGRARLGQPNRSIFAYTAVAGLNRFLTHPKIVPRYYQAFLDLIDQVYNSRTLNPLMDQLLRGFVPGSEIDAMKRFVADRINGVLSQIPREFAISSALPRVAGVPRTTRPHVSLTGTADTVRTQSVLVHGQLADWSPFTREWTLSTTGSGESQSLVDFRASWRYLDDGTDQATGWRQTDHDDSRWTQGAAPLGYGIGSNSAGAWQDTSQATASHRWRVDRQFASVRINEILAHNQTAFPHHGTYPDAIELYNPAATSIDLSGMRLTDDPNRPARFVFPAGTVIGPDSYLVVLADQRTDLPGLHLGFSLASEGERGRVRAAARCAWARAG